MPLSDTYEAHHSCLGDASGFGSFGEVVDQIEAFLRQTLPRIIQNLHGWNVSASGQRKRRQEKILAADLSKELNFAATDELFYFHPEDPENESAIRALDYGTYPKSRLRVQGCCLGARQRIYGIEAKRLPTMETPLDGREREYVVGDWQDRSLPSKKMKGGIERLKEGLHGDGLTRAGMIGFVQRNSSIHWLTNVNQWINDLSTNGIISHHAPWTQQDKLVQHPDPGLRVTEFTSAHARPNRPIISLLHFWLDLTAS